MANLPIHSPLDFNTILRMLETTDLSHADTFNPLFERLLNNDAFMNSLITTMKTKLDGIASNANNYVHPSTHPATMITVADAKNYYAATNVEGVLEELFQSFTSMLLQYMKLGDNNQSVNKVKALQFNVDTRGSSLVFTNDKLTSVLEKDGNTTVKTTKLNYNSDGTLKDVQVIIGSTTTTTSLNYVNGRLDSLSRSVVG